MSNGVDFVKGISPSRRSYKMPELPVKEFQGLNGAVTAIQYGKKPVDSELTLEFTNISDDKAFEIFENYQAVQGGRNPDNGRRYWVNLSKEFTIGPMAGVLNESLAGVMTEKKGNRRYRYAEPPVITSVFPGVCNVTVKFRGYLDGADSL